MVEKFVGGDVEGDPDVQSTIREGNFFPVFFPNLQVLVAGGCGQRC